MGERGELEIDDARAQQVTSVRRATEGALRLEMHANPHTPSDTERRAQGRLRCGHKHSHREVYRKLQTYKYIQAQT